MQSLVIRPEPGPDHESCRRKKVHIDKSDADTDEAAPLDKFKNLLMRGNYGLRQAAQSF